MDISEQSVREHYGQILGVGKQWEVEKVEVEHTARRLEAWVRWRSGRRLHCPECERVCPGLAMLIGGAHHLHLAAKDWLRPIAHWLGQFSYPCYVLHLQLMIAIDRLLLPKLGGAFLHNPVLRSLSLIAPTLLALALIGPWLEGKTMSWRAGVLSRIGGTKKGNA